MFLVFIIRFERVYEDIGIVSVVVTPLKLFYAAVHALDSFCETRTSDRILEQPPSAFNVVCMNITHNPFLFRVVDGFVASILVGNSYELFRT